MTSDRFKFRAWDTYCKRMRYEEDYVIVSDTGKPHWIHDQETIQGEATQLILMQSTGIKDVENNLTYEGDKVELTRKAGFGTAKGDIYKVVWSKSRASFLLKDAVQELSLSGKYFKIIGNIYET